jgi:hypothetical protein
LLRGRVSPSLPIACPATQKLTIEQVAKDVMLLSTMIKRIAKQKTNKK